MRQLVHFDYDPLGRRIRKHDAFGTTHFVWDGIYLLQERRGNDCATYVYEPESHMPLARLDSRVDGGHDSAANDPVISTVPPGSNGGVYYFHNDVSGMPEELTTASGEIAWQAEYSTCGNTLTETWVAPAAYAGRPLPQNLRFQGQYADRETGLHYNTFRFYDPDTGAFISPDPI